MKQESPEKDVEIISVLRLIQYIGPRDWVETTLNKGLKGTVNLGTNKTIKSVVIGNFPDIMEVKTSES